MRVLVGCVSQIVVHTVYRTSRLVQLSLQTFHLLNKKLARFCVHADLVLSYGNSRDSCFSGSTEDSGSRRAWETGI